MTTLRIEHGIPIPPLPRKPSQRIWVKRRRRRMRPTQVLVHIEHDIPIPPRPHGPLRFGVDTYAFARLTESWKLALGFRLRPTDGLLNEHPFLECPIE